MKLRNSLLLMIPVSLVTVLSYADEYTPVIPTQQEQQQYFANGKNYGKNFNNSESNVKFQNNTNIQSGVTTSFNAAQKAGANITLGESILNNNGGNYDKNGNPTNLSKNNYSQAKSNPVYQYNSSQDQISKCRNSKYAPGSQESAACNAVNRYTDDDFRRNLDAYHQDGFNYWNQRLISPDPNNSTCSIIKTWEPVNPKEQICLVGRRTTPTCQSTLSAWQETIYHPANYYDGQTLLTYGVPMGADSATWTVVVYTSKFKSGFLDFIGSASSGVSGTQTVKNSIPMTAIGADISVGNFYIDWHGNKRGNIYFTIKAGSPGCNSNSCVYNISLTGNDVNDYRTITVTKPVDAYNEYINHFDYYDGCSSYKGK